MTVEHRISEYPDEIFKVKRANVSLRVTRNEVDKYYSEGYDVYSITGKLLKRATPTDVPTLQKAFVDNQNLIEMLEARIDKLNARIRELENGADVVETKPKKRSTLKK